MNNPDLAGTAKTATPVTESENKFSIKVADPAPFPCLIESTMITLTKLMELTSELISLAYKDYVGNYIFVGPDNRFYVTLYFAPPSIQNDAASMAFTTAAQEAKNRPSGIIAGLKNLENRGSQRIYTLTQDGKDGLADFFIKDANKVYPDWKQCVGELAQYAGNMQGVYATVTGLDIYKIIAKIFGEKVDGEYVQYQLSAVKPLGSTQNGVAAGSDWLLSLQRVSITELNNLARSAGFVPTGAIPMIGRK